MRRALPAVVGLCALGLWAALSARLPEVLLPSPLEVARALVDHAPRLGEAALTTTAAALLGLLLAAVFGGGAGVLFARSPALERAFAPYTLLLQTVPVVAIAPLLVVWLGYGLKVSVCTAALVSFFPILTATVAGLRATPPEQLDLLRLYGATELQTLWRLRLPSAAPFVFAGLRSSAGLSVIGAIVGEFVGSNGAPVSLGYLVLRSARSADTPLTFAAIVASTALALTLYTTLRRLEAKLIGAWHPGVT
ncbi:ABC transporter permease [Myxococcota bacterium]|nr:ABC transporter permease [Myxococcota bacterium]